VEKISRDLVFVTFGKRGALVENTVELISSVEPLESDVCCPLLTRLDTVNGTPIEILESIPGMIRAAAYECQKRIRKTEKLVNHHTESCAFWSDCHNGFDHPRDCDCGADKREKAKNE